MGARGESGHVRLVKRKRGDKWYMKYRYPSGRQVQECLGPAWSEKDGRPPAGHYTRKLAEAELQAKLTDIRRGELHDPGGRVGRTLRETCDEWLRYVEHDRQRAPSTVRDYRNVVEGSLIPEFGADTPLEAIDTERIDSYRERLLAEGRLSRRTVQKTLVLLHGIFKRAKRRKRIATSPAADAERVSVKRSGDFNVLTPVQVEAVARAAETDQDAVLFCVAAFTGLRMGELRALRWGDVDFTKRTIIVRAGYTYGAVGPLKSGKVRSVPLIDQAAGPLDRLSRRERFTGEGDLVFCSLTGGYRDDGKVRDAFYGALSAAELGHLRDKADPITFHDLRHTFGTLGAAVWPLHDLQAYMGHADIQTTMIYVHHVPRVQVADELTRAVEGAITALEPSLSQLA